ncbi:MAG: hypothetical protein GX369_01490 [Euryarchaeota archaeon]|nr:hypothetical protein [Euryarchaeota archaeon]
MKGCQIHKPDKYRSISIKKGRFRIHSHKPVNYLERYLLISPDFLSKKSFNNGVSLNIEELLNVDESESKYNRFRSSSRKRVYRKVIRVTNNINTNDCFKHDSNLDYLRESYAVEHYDSKRAEDMKTVRRTYSLPADITNLIDQLYIITRKSKSDIVAEAICVICIMRVLMPDILESVVRLAKDLRE